MRMYHIVRHLIIVNQSPSLTRRYLYSELFNKNPSLKTYMPINCQLKGPKSAPMLYRTPANTPDRIESKQSCEINNSDTAALLKISDCLSFR